MKSVLKKAATDTRGERALPPDLLERYECGPVQFSGDPNASYDRHLVFDHVVRPGDATPRERFEALARSLRDLLSQRWLKTGRGLRPREPQAGLLPVDGVPHRPVADQQHHQPPGRAVRARGGIGGQGLDLDRLAEEEPDAGLGNGGLGRLAACFLDSMATLADPGHRLRPALRVRHLPPGDRGRLAGRAARQLAAPARPLGGRPPRGGGGRPRPTARSGSHGGAPILVPDAPTVLRGIPYDRPVVGYGGRTINTLRLWGAAAPDSFDFGEFSGGDFFGAVHDKVAAENLTRVLYPDDSTRAGEGAALRPGVLPRLLLARRHRPPLPQTRQRLAGPARQGRHPAQRHPPGAGRRRADADPARRGRARLGRGVGPDRADAGLHQPHAAARGAGEVAGRASSSCWPRGSWRSSTRSTAGSSTTSARSRPGDDGLVARVSLIEEGPEKKVRMAHLAIVGSHSTNGVAAHPLRAAARRPC